MNREFKILIGKNSTKTCFGIIGLSRSIRYGGYTNYRYGIKGLFAIGYYVGWGEFKDLTNAFK